MELREKIARQVCPLSDKPNECKFCHEYKGCPDSWSDVTKTTDQIIKLFQEHYAELAEKSGLNLTPEEIKQTAKKYVDEESTHVDWVWEYES